MSKQTYTQYLANALGGKPVVTVYHPHMSHSEEVRRLAKVRFQEEGHCLNPNEYVVCLGEFGAAQDSACTIKFTLAQLTYNEVDAEMEGL